MKIKVTADHIVHGTPGECTSCPIALAIREQYGYDNVGVTDTLAEVEGDYILLPAEAQRFVYRFDQGLSVDPFEFDLGEYT